MIHSKIALILLASCSLVMTACGGGGGGGGSSTPQATSSSGSSTASTSSSSTSSSTSSTTSSSSSASSSSSDDSSSSNDDSSSSAGDSNIADMLRGITDNAIIPNYEAQATAITNFAASTGSLAAYCDAIGTDSEAATLTTAQNEWKTVMVTIQQAEPHAVGPIAVNDDYLRNRIHSFANADLQTCSVDQAVIKQSDANFDLSTRSNNQKGFGAIEYLLFDTTLTSQCSANYDNAATWNALGDTEKKSQRCTYAKALAADADTAATSVLNKWQASGENYRAEFIDEASSGNNLQALTDVLLIHIDKEAKDRKMQEALGISGCTSDECRARIESPYSKTSLENVKNNMIGFLNVYNGGEGVGFDNYLSDMGEKTISDGVISKITAIQTNLDSTTVALVDQVASLSETSNQTACTNAYGNPSTPSAEFSACVLTGLLSEAKAYMFYDFAVTINVTIPDAAAGDND